MHVSLLARFLEGQATVVEVKRVIAVPMAAYRENLRKVGSSRPIVIDRDERIFQIEARHVKRLCEEYLCGNLDEIEVDYLATAIQLIPELSYASEAVEDAIFLISDPEVNGPLSKSLVLEVLNSLA